MTTRFRVDLLHPGAGLRQRGAVAQVGEQWFVGPTGTKRLAVFALACIAILAVVFVALILPPYWRLSGDLSALPGLRRDLAARDADLTTLRSNVGALTEEARRQVRWADLLVTLSQQIPPGVKLHLVDAGRGLTASGQPATGAAANENTIKIEAVTPVRPGSPPLMEVAQFMAGIMRDPAVSKRFQLKSWEIKPGPASGGTDQQLLNVSIVLSERPQ
jgi:hypothetical protein